MVCFYSCFRSFKYALMCSIIITDLGNLSVRYDYTQKKGYHSMVSLFCIVHKLVTAFVHNISDHLPDLETYVSAFSGHGTGENYTGNQVFGILPGVGAK